MSTDEDFLAAIRAGDEASRAVYADSLEQRGFIEHAEFVRINHPTNTREELDAKTTRLRQLCMVIEHGWRADVARPIVEGCTKMVCPGEWCALRSTDATTRTCSTCERAVHYCFTEGEFLDHAMRGELVAADVEMK